MDDEFDTVRVPSGDVQLHLVRSRPVPGERRAPVLMVHGFPDSHRTWSRQLEGLAPMHPVAAYDQRGVGRSTAPSGREGYAIARHLDDIAAAIDAVAGPEGQIHLVGHDWGGVLAWFFAGDPARAARLRSLSVLAAPHPGAANVQVTRRVRRHGLADLAFLGDQARRSWYAILFQLPWLPEWYLRRDPVGLWIRAHRAGGVRADDPELAEIDERLALSTLLPPLALYRQIAGHRAPPGPIAVPVCLVVPLRDLALSPGLYDNAPEFVPELEMHRIDDNHWVHRSRAAEVNHILHDFIDRHDP